jgi:hypothetical protein
LLPCRCLLVLLQLLQLHELRLLQQHVLLLLCGAHRTHVRQGSLCEALALQQLLELQRCRLGLLELLLLRCYRLGHVGSCCCSG